MFEVFPKAPDFQNSILSKVWQRKDTLVITSGSLPCMREVSYRAHLLKKLHQVRYVPLTIEDYVVGTAEDKILATAKEAAVIKGVRIIVLYLSCPDVLIRIDTGHLQQRLEEETNKIINICFRGPMGAVDRTNHPTLQSCMETWPEEVSAIEACIEQIPLPMPDNNALIDAFSFSEEIQLMVTPKGCRNCLGENDFLGNNRVFVTELKEKDYVFGAEETVGKDIQSLQEEGPEKLALIETAIPSLMAFNEACLPLDKEPIYLRSCKSNGFLDGIAGVSQYTYDFVKAYYLERYEGKEMKKSAKEGKTVLVLGYSPFLCGPLSELEAGIAFLEKAGYKTIILGRGSLEENLSALECDLLWVVSVAGLKAGKWLSSKSHIPLLYGIPFSAERRLCWKEAIGKISNKNEALWTVTEDKNGSLSSSYDQRKAKERILFLGEALEAIELSHYLSAYGYEHFSHAHFIWSKETSALYKELPTMTSNGFRNKKELEALVQSATIVIGDPFYKGLAMMKDKRFVSLPWGMVSGRRYFSDTSRVKYMKELLYSE